MEKEIENILKESCEIKIKSIKETKRIAEAAKLIIEAYKKGKKVMICGNGGSAADSQHFAAELIQKISLKRKALPCIALTTDSSVLTAISNDDSFEDVFSRQVEALAKEGDIVIGISTSGDSKNVIKAVKKAKELKSKTIGLTGEEGRLKGEVDLAITVPSKNTARIQEAHITILHIIGQLVETEFYNNEKSNLF